MNNNNIGKYTQKKLWHIDFDWYKCLAKKYTCFWFLDKKKRKRKRRGEKIPIEWHRTVCNFRITIWAIYRWVANITNRFFSNFIHYGVNWAISAKMGCSIIKRMVAVITAFRFFCCCKFRFSFFMWLSISDSNLCNI